MKVMVLSNNKLEVKDINKGLEALQEIVGGYIEIPFLSEKLYEHNIDMIINEEGKLVEGMKPEIAVVKEETGKILDIVYGNCIFASHNDEGDTIALNEEQMEVLMEELETEVELMNSKTFEEFRVRVLFI